MPRKRVYPHREPRLTPAQSAAIVRQRWQHTMRIIELQALAHELHPDTADTPPPSAAISEARATAIASDFAHYCTHEYDHRSRSIQPRRPQPHRQTPGRLDDYLGRRYDLERRTTDTAQIRSIRP